MQFQRLIAVIVCVMVAMTGNSVAADEVQDAAAGVVRVLSVGEDYYGSSTTKGTGFAIAPGVIMTNAHVVANAYNTTGRALVAIVPSRAAKPIQAQILAYDQDKDMALLRFRGEAIAPLAIFSGLLPAGSNVNALGYPANVDAATGADELEAREPVRAVGNFSNLDRVKGIESILHTAKINQGSSGGPLVDDCGRVVGINTAATADNRGGESFPFAITTNELLAFARRNGVTATIKADECVTAAARASMAATETLKQDLEHEREKARLELERLRLEGEQKQRATEEVQTQRENHLAVAAVLLLLGGIAAVLGLNHRSAGREELGRKWLIGGGIAAAVAVAAFFTRPSLAEAGNVLSAPAAQPAPTTGASQGVVDAGQAAASASGQTALSCTLDPGQSQQTAMERDVVPVTIDGAGCVNGRTQYARTGANSWQRISVLNGENTVVRSSFDMANRTYTQERWVVDPEVMGEVRQIRERVMRQGCVQDQAALDQLADGQRQVISAITSAPGERRVYNCRTGG